MGNKCRRGKCEGIKMIRSVLRDARRFISSQLLEVIRRDVILQVKGNEGEYKWVTVT